jgi:DNA-binding NarL/FixJ family response regulator
MSEVLAVRKQRESPVQPGCFLVIDDDPIATRSIARVLGRFGAVTTASSAAEARGFVEARPTWSGLVIDLWLPDGSGLDVLTCVRQHVPLAPAVLLSGDMDPEAVNAAFALDARCLCKPCPTEHLRQFALEALLAEREVPSRIRKAVRDLASRHALTPAQTEILLSAVRGIDRASIVASRHVSENTHKTQVRSILRKTRTLSLGELRDRVLRSVAGAA